VKFLTVPKIPLLANWLRTSLDKTAAQELIAVIKDIPQLHALLTPYGKFCNDMVINEAWNEKLSEYRPHRLYFLPELEGTLSKYCSKEQTDAIITWSEIPSIQISISVIRHFGLSEHYKVLPDFQALPIGGFNDRFKRYGKGIEALVAILWDGVGSSDFSVLSSSKRQFDSLCRGMASMVCDDYVQSDDWAEAYRTIAENFPTESPTRMITLCRLLLSLLIHRATSNNNKIIMFNQFMQRTPLESIPIAYLEDIWNVLHNIRQNDIETYEELSPTAMHQMELLFPIGMRVIWGDQSYRLNRWLQFLRRYRDIVPVTLPCRTHCSLKDLWGWLQSFDRFFLLDHTAYSPVWIETVDEDVSKYCTSFADVLAIADDLVVQNIQISNLPADTTGLAKLLIMVGNLLAKSLSGNISQLSGYWATLRRHYGGPATERLSALRIWDFTHHFC
jgi:hypothetical protein